MKQENWMEQAKKMVVTAGAMLLVAAVGCGLLAWTVCGEWLPVKLAGHLIWVWMIGAIMVGCCVTARKAAKHRLAVAVCTAVPVAGVLLLTKGLFFQTQPLRLLAPLGMIFASAVMAGVLASRKKTRRR